MRRGTPDTNSQDDGPEDMLRPEQITHRDPPAYPPLDAYTYSEGVHIDLPAARSLPLRWKVALLAR